jgi:hypothetical protein
LEYEEIPRSGWIKWDRTTVSGQADLPHRRAGENPIVAFYTKYSCTAVILSYLYIKFKLHHLIELKETLGKPKFP